MQKNVDNYFLEGCGRCSLGGTPDCKVYTWATELKLLREIILDCGLTEEIKWGVPCYTFQQKNILILSAFKEFCSLNFLKGVLLKDPLNILEKAGENTQSARLIKFRKPEEVLKIKDKIKTYIFETLENEKAGLKVTLNKNPEPIPKELEEKFEEDPIIKSAFYALTKGRQRGYILHFSAPKQTKTRASRINKCVGKILKGEGMHDAYKKKQNI
ncbi:YdeI/OmpD-associated family protein [Polaribacter haliotis]|uniref:YdeI/OmpD-associated family protein n=1 Tax=Polaribacter haliotis TaxID=1888915 RepID=A0A7L8AFK2_9FLAO|nr:DUF1801 domain-containing protein [Polaribacter haliotis]QOD60740.1 YdeI/OmpD-associated family protein [Polaribacter haliotis]